MDITSTQGLLAILQIIIIDILLAGDNAIVIGMAAKNLPERCASVLFSGEQQVRLFYVLLWPFCSLKP